MSVLYPVILAGGSGTRFWPLSRSALPKQFLPLASDRPLIVETFQRIRTLARPKQILVVCGKTHAPIVRRVLKQLPPGNILIEPIARNTAAAIGLAAVRIFKEDPGGILAVLPSDHHVAEPEQFRDCIRQAAALADEGYLVTLGIQPSRPETGFGYIRIGDPLPRHGRKVLAFVEKPTLERARIYAESGEYLWNSGIFLFRASAILQAFHQHLPELSKGFDALRRTKTKPAYDAQVRRIFRSAPAVSIDYGVMEKADNLAVVPGSFGWSDVGSFGALGEVKTADADGNIVVGNRAVLVDCHNCVVISGPRLLTLAAISDCVVVDSKDALMIVAKDKVQDVRRIVEAVRGHGLKNYL